MNVINQKTVDHDIQIAGGKNAGAAKMLLRKLLQRGAKGFRYSSMKALNYHADARVLLDLGYAQVADGVVFAGREVGCKLLIDPQLAEKLQPQAKVAGRKKQPNKKKEYLWGK
ncbi:MAG: hypothetical protein WEC39_00360 [Patescibacteria group bacterium]